MIYFLTLEEVIEIHHQQIVRFGGSEGIRELSLLQSAIEMPEQGFGDEYFHAYPFEMAAAYLFHLSKNHAFVDGNKRTATACMLTFLRLNGYRHQFDLLIIEDLVIKTATGKYNKTEIAQKLEQYCTKI